MITTIEEGIWDIQEKKPLRKAIFKYDGSSITRNLFMLGDSEKRNSKIDVINSFSIEISKINELSPKQIGKLLKKQLSECFDNNIKSELKFYTCPIITKK